MVSILISLAALLTTISLAVLAVSVAVFVRRWLETSDGSTPGPRTETAPTASTEPTPGTDAETRSEGEGAETDEAESTAEPTPAAPTGGEDDRDRSVTDTREAVLLREKLRAYREIMDAAVSLNRAALALNEEEFRHAADAIAFDQESELREPYLDANEAFESNLYIIDERVRQATSDYVDYLATYHDEGAHAGGLLGRAGDIYEAMRADLGLETLFDEDAAPPKHGGGDIMPEPTGETPEVEDFTEELGKPEDLEYFSAGKRQDGETDTDPGEEGADHGPEDSRSSE